MDISFYYLDKYIKFIKIFKIKQFFQRTMSNATVDETYSILNTVQSIYGLLNTVILYSGLIIEVLWFVLFLYRIFKKDYNFITPYYIILLIGYFVNIIPAIIFIPTEILKVQFVCFHL